MHLSHFVGLSASKLNNDEKLVSVQGHLIMLKDQNPKNLLEILTCCVF
jgi:hypothetical protein